MTTTAHTTRRIAAGLLALAAACGSGQPAQPKQFREQLSSNLETENGLSAWVITQACLSVDVVPPPGDGTPVDPSLDPTLVGFDPTSCGDMMNGLPPNLLGLNGLHAKGLNNNQFQKWFAADPASSSLLMKYLVRCSLPAVDRLTYTDPNGVVYSWTGGFALAPQWASGNRIPEVEQQLVSGCVAAHANKYGVHVPISVLANGPDGSPIPYTADELSTYSVTEGCFFGNFFKKDGVFAGDDRVMPLTSADSSLRACALPDRSGGGASSNCTPITYAGSCRDLCQTDPTGMYYTSCTVNGKSYRPVATRIRPTVQYTCGDGVCQMTEKCGTGSTWDNCGLDCGPCN